MLTSSIVNTATVNAVPALEDGTALGTKLDAAATDSVDVSLVLDPPSAFKTVTTQGPRMEWKMVWINSSSHAVADVEIWDEIPAGTSFTLCPPASMSVQMAFTVRARGSSVTESCYLEAPGRTYPRGRIMWSGKIGGDAGRGQEGSAANEVVIRFYTTLQDDKKDQTISNQGHSSWDMNGDGKAEYADVITDDNSTSDKRDSTSAVYGDKAKAESVQIPTLSEWAMIMLSLMILLFSAARLRRA